MRLFGYHLHNCDDPWVDAPPHIIEIREMLRVIIDGQRAIIGKENYIMNTLDDDLAAVTAQGTRLDSVNVLLTSVETQLADALSGTTLPPAAQAKVDALFTALHANDAKIDTALNSNVPPPPPAAPPAAAPAA